MEGERRAMAKRLGQTNLIECSSNSCYEGMYIPLPLKMLKIPKTN